MMRVHQALRRSGFTLVELLVVVAVIVIVLILAAPSFREMIEMQRLRSISAQVVTDVQFARSEAAARQRRIFMAFQSGTSPGMTCYIVYACASESGCTCSCTVSSGPRCLGSNVEVRTVQVPTPTGVKVTLTPTETSTPTLIAFDPATGGMLALSTDPLAGLLPLPGPAWIDTALTRANPPVIRTVVAQTGRPSQCAPAVPVSGMPTC